jgi:hypothetical protein
MIRAHTRKGQIQAAPCAHAMAHAHAHACTRKCKPYERHEGCAQAYCGKDKYDSLTLQAGEVLRRVARAHLVDDDGADVNAGDAPVAGTIQSRAEPRVAAATDQHSIRLWTGMWRVCGETCERHVCSCVSLYTQCIGDCQHW